MRLKGTGARVSNSGPAIGERASPITLTAEAGNRITEMNQRGVSSLILFITPGCDSCDDLMRSAHSISRSEAASTDVFVFSMSDDASRNRAFLKKHALAPDKFADASSIVEAYQIGGSPYAVLLDPTGVTISKGLANTLEHLESLLNARDEGFATQDDRIRYTLSLIHI